MRIAILLLSALVLAPAASAAIEDPGVLPVGWRDISFDDDIFGQGTILARIYYPALDAGRDTPADPSQGPYPLIAFQHGYLGEPRDYDDLCTHLASWGFLVASTGTETGFFADVDQYARDTRSLLHWVDRESGDSQSWLHAMAWDGDWGASGHSMGGGTLGLLIGIEPRVRTIVGLQSAGPEGEGADHMRAFTGIAAQVAGSADWIVRPHTVHDWFELADSAPRNLYFEVQGMGHTGCTDTPPGWEPLPGADQIRLHKRLVTGLFRAETGGLEEDLYADLLGEGMSLEPVRRESECADPPFWTRPSAVEPDCYVAGLGGFAGATAAIAFATESGSMQTPYGELGLDPDLMRVVLQEALGAEGWREIVLCPGPEWSGSTVYSQGLVADPLGGALSRVVETALP